MLLVTIYTISKAYNHSSESQWKFKQIDLAEETLISEKRFLQEKESDFLAYTTVKSRKKRTPGKVLVINQCCLETWISQMIIIPSNVAQKWRGSKKCGILMGRYCEGLIVWQRAPS